MSNASKVPFPLPITEPLPPGETLPRGEAYGLDSLAIADLESLPRESHKNMASRTTDTSTAILGGVADTVHHDSDTKKAYHKSDTEMTSLQSESSSITLEGDSDRSVLEQNTDFAPENDVNMTTHANDSETTLRISAPTTTEAAGSYIFPTGYEGASKRILIMNPNSNKLMTNDLVQLVRTISNTLPLKVQPVFYTGPEKCPYSINNEDDADTSNQIIYREDLQDPNSREPEFDAYLVACYSAHPLVKTLRDAFPSRHVIGILEASIITALSIGPSKPGDTNSKFGIVTTGKYWEEALSNAVRDFITNHAPFPYDDQTHAALGRFKGVESTGLNGDELHSAHQDLVKKRLTEATKRLVRDGDVKVVILGCAGMSGLNKIVEEALVEEVGEDQAENIYVLDGVAAGIGLLENLLRSCPRKRKDKREV